MKTTNFWDFFLSKIMQKIRRQSAATHMPPTSKLGSNSARWCSLVGSELLDVVLDIEFSDVVLDEGLSKVDAGDLDLGFFWDEIHLSFSFLNANKKLKGLKKINDWTYLFLKLEWDTSDWALLNSLHKMCGETYCKSIVRIWPTKSVSAGPAPSLPINEVFLTIPRL